MHLVCATQRTAVDPASDKVMFVTVYKIVREGVFVYVNDKSWCTTKIFIPNKRIVPWIQLVPGEQLVCNMDDMTVRRGHFNNCHYCHKTSESNAKRVECDCKNSEMDLLTSQGILISKEYKMYKKGGGLKMKLQSEDGGDIMHTVVFESDALFTSFNELPLGVMIHFKAIVKGIDNGNILLKIFHFW